MKSAVKKYWQDPFWRNNAIFLASSLLVAFINYLYYPVLGRLMNVANFGEVQTVLSIFNLIGISLAAFQIVIVSIVANKRKNGTEVIQQLEKLTLLVMVITATIVAAFSVQLQDFFGFKSFTPFMLLALTLIVSVLAASRKSFIQGMNDFVSVSISNSIGAIGKLIISAGLVIIGLQTMGAIAGILIAQILAFLYAAKIAKRYNFNINKQKFFSLPKFELLKPEGAYILSVLVVFLAVTLLYTGDMLVVKRYFDPIIAGQFAGISAISNIIFFATASFAGVLLSSVGEINSTEHNQRIHKKSFLLVGGIGGVILLVFTLFPEFIVTLLLGGRYSEYAYLLPLLSLVNLMVALINLYFYYLLALRQLIIVPIAIFGAATTFLLTLVRHDTLEAVIVNFLIGSIVIIISLLSLRLYYRMRNVNFKTV